MIGHKKQTQSHLFPWAKVLSKMARMRVGVASGERIPRKGPMMKK
jgi:hypothetical protein